MKKYTIEYDKQADAAYIKVSGNRVVDTIEADKDMFVDVDKNKHIVGIEILNFSRIKVNIANLIAKQFENLIVIK